FGFVLDALGKPGAMVPMIMPRRLAETPPNRPVTEPIGSGPYRFVAEEYRPGDRIVLVRNAAYRARQEPSVWASGGKRARLERVELIAMPDVSSQVSALLTGEVDYVERLPADVLPVLEHNRNVRVEVVSSYGYQGILRFNHLQPPFDDARVRRAVMLAVDQAQYLPAAAGRADYARECRSMYGCGTRYETTAGMPPATDMAAARTCAGIGCGAAPTARGEVRRGRREGDREPAPRQCAGDRSTRPSHASPADPARLPGRFAEHGSQHVFRSPGKARGMEHTPYHQHRSRYAEPAAECVHEWRRRSRRLRLRAEGCRGRTPAARLRCDE